MQFLNLNVHRHATFVPFHCAMNCLNFLNVATYKFYFRIPLIERPLSKIHEALLISISTVARR